MPKENYSTLCMADVADGLPCTKYILRSMTKHDQLKKWQRTYVEQLTKLGLSADEIEQCFDTVKLKIPKSSAAWSFDLKEPGNVIYKDDFVTSIIMDEDIPGNVTCEKLYYCFDKAKKACELCPFSRKFRCANASQEKLLVRYLLESEHTAARFFSFGMNENMFSCVVDFNAPFIDDKTAYIISLYSCIVSAMSDAAFRARFFCSEKKETLLVEEIYNHILNLKRISYKSVLEAEFEPLFRIPLPSDKEVQDAVSVLMSSKKVKRKRRSLSASAHKAESPDLLSLMFSSELEADALSAPTADTFNDSAGSDTVSGVAPEPFSDCIKTVSYDDPVMSGLHNALSGFCGLNGDADISGMGVSEPVQPEGEDSDKVGHSAQMNAGESDKPDSVCSIETELPFGEPDIVDAAVHEPCADSSDSFSANKNHGDECRAEHEEACHTEVSTTVYEVVDNNDVSGYTRNVNSFQTPGYETSMNMNGDFIFHPVVRISELRACAIPLNTGNMFAREKFESHVEKDKSFCAEVVLADDGQYYVLLWVPRLNTYFYTDLVFKPALEVLLPLFSHKSICVICYSPYLLYAKIKKCGGQIRNIQSLQTRHYMHDRTHPDYVSAMLSYGIHPAVPGINYKCSGSVSSPVFQYMPYYSIVFRKQERLLTENTASFYRTACQLAEAIGYSFDLRNLTGGDSWLVTMPEPLTFSFCHVAKNSIVDDGYYVTYCADIPFPVFRDTVCEITKKGCFRKKTLALLTLGKSGCAFFVSDDYAASFMSMFHSLFSAICVNYGAYGTTLSVRYEHTGKPVLK